MTSSAHRLNLRPALRCAAAALALTGALLHTAVAGAYDWPVKPFDRQHPVRGFFGDPRIDVGSHTIHFGIDISAPDGTPVYATRSGRVLIERPEVVAVVASDGTRFEYWHVVPAVRSGAWATAQRTVVGHVAAGWGHVHLSELVGGVHVNPLRPGALAPYSDTTRPLARNLTVERDGVPLRGRRASGRVDLVVEASDETPLAVPAPWNARPVAPALVRWRIAGVTGWTTAVDFTGALPAAGFEDVYARWTRQNHPWSDGRYRFVLRRGLDTGELPDGTYRVEVLVSDTAGNAGRDVETIVVANGPRAGR